MLVNQLQHLDVFYIEIYRQWGRHSLGEHRKKDIQCTVAIGIRITKLDRQRSATIQDTLTKADGRDWEQT